MIISISTLNILLPKIINKEKDKSLKKEQLKNLTWNKAFYSNVNNQNNKTKKSRSFNKNIKIK